MEVIYTGRQNTIDFGLALNNVSFSAPTPLNVTNKIRLLVSDRAGVKTTFDSVNNPTMFSVAKRRMVLGKTVNLVTLTLGFAGLAEGPYNMTLTVYDPTFTSGVVVGEFQAEVRPS